jgi:hypothetical protein
MTTTDLKPPRRASKPTIWARRSAKGRDAAPVSALTPPQKDALPLDVINWVITRYCMAVAAEDRKGKAADLDRIERVLRATATLAGDAAPFYHRRLKPGDVAPGAVAQKTELIVSWTPPPNYKPPHYKNNTPLSAPVEADRPGEPQAAE